MDGRATGEGLLGRWIQGMVDPYVSWVTMGWADVCLAGWPHHVHCNKLFTLYLSAVCVGVEQLRVLDMVDAAEDGLLYRCAVDADNKLLRDV